MIPSGAMILFVVLLVLALVLSRLRRGRCGNFTFHCFILLAKIYFRSPSVLGSWFLPKDGGVSPWDCSSLLLCSTVPSMNC